MASPRSVEDALKKVRLVDAEEDELLYPTRRQHSGSVGSASRRHLLLNSVLEVDASSATGQAHRSSSSAELVKHLSNVQRSGQAISGARLRWEAPPTRFLVFLKKDDTVALDRLQDLARWLMSRNRECTVLIETSQLKESLHALDAPEFADIRSIIHAWDKENGTNGSELPDLIITMGGDGTLLYAASIFQGIMPPAVCFNFGSLGFLANFSFDNFQYQMNRVFSGDCFATVRMRLFCEIQSDHAVDDTISGSNNDGHATNHHQSSAPLTCESNTDLRSFHVLNEVVLDRGPSPYLSNIELYVDDVLVTVVQGDGLIIATPTGSTAYSVAAGGSMVHPGVPTILITPICPHSISFRPILVPSTARLKIASPLHSRANAWASFDGRYRREIKPSETLHVRASMWPVSTLNNERDKSDWFESISSCLRWNDRVSQKEMTKK